MSNLVVQTHVLVTPSYLFVCGISLTSGQLVSELFPDLVTGAALTLVSQSYIEKTNYHRYDGRFLHSSNKH